MDIKKIILEALTEQLEFYPHPDARRNYYPQGLEEVGYLIRRLTLFWVLSWTGLDESDQYKIWSIFDDLSTKRQLKIVNIAIDKHLSANDILMIAEVGTGVRTWEDGGRKIIHKAFYWEHPLSEEEIKSRGITKPSDVIEQLRAERDKVFKNTFGGHRDFEIEKRLDLEMMQAEVEYRKNIAFIANWIREQKRIKKGISIEPFKIDGGERH